MAEEQMDIVARYAKSQGWHLQTRIVLVEGTSDVTLFELAARLFKSQTEKDLLAGLSIVAAGEGERGGTHGVVRKLMVLRDLAEDHLSPQGKPVYNVIGLFDNDTAGRKAVIGAKHWDASILEYRDVFRLHPIMPKSGSLDLGALQRNFLALNAPHKSLDWELEDLIGRALITRFLAEYQTALVRSSEVAGQIHYELTRDGKSRLVRFCKEHADISSMQGLIEVLHALRFYQRLPPLQ